MSKQDPEVLIKMKGDVKDLKKKNEEVKKSINELTMELTSTQKQWQSIGQGMMLTGAALTAAVVVPLATMSKASIDAAADFEQGMASVAAVSGAVADEFAVLEEQAKQLGATTRFTAVEASQGMQMLGRAGWEAAEILEAMPGLLNLAAAGMLDLGRAADIISDVMMAFGESADQAARYADIFASAAANANTTVEGLGQAMAYAAPAASNMGVSIEQTAASLSMFADAGIKATRAGTTMDAMLRELRNKVGEGGEIDFEHFTVSVYDADGAMRDFYDILGETFAGMEGLTQQQQDHAAGLIFSTRALRGFNLLQTSGIERMREMESTLKSSTGAAEDMADIMMDTLHGAMIELSSAFDGLKIAFGEVLIPLVTRFVQGITLLIRAFTAIPTPIKVMMTVFAGLTAALILGTTLFGVFIVLIMKALSMGPKYAAIVKMKAVSMSGLAVATDKATQSMARQQLAMQAQIGSFKMMRRDIGYMIRLSFFRLVQVIHNNVIPAFGALGSKIIALTWANVIKAAVHGIKVAFFSLVKVIHNYVIPAFAKLFSFIMAHPVLAIITAIMAGAIALSRYMHNQLTTDLRDFTEVSSEETNKIVNYHLKMCDDIRYALRTLSSDVETISEEMYEGMMKNFEQVSEGIISHMHRARDEAIVALEEMLTYTGVFDSVKMEETVDALRDHFAEQERILLEYGDRRVQIHKEMIKNQGVLTDEHIRELDRMEKHMQEMGIDVLAESLGEAQQIRTQMQAHEKAQNAQHAADMIVQERERHLKELEEIESGYQAALRAAAQYEDIDEQRYNELLDAAELYRSSKRAIELEAHAQMLRDLQEFSGVYMVMMDSLTGEIRDMWYALHLVAMGFQAPFKLIYDLIAPITKVRSEAKKLEKVAKELEEQFELTAEEALSIAEQLKEVADEFELTAEAVELLNDALDLDEDEFLEVLSTIIEMLNLTGEEAEEFVDKMNSLRVDAQGSIVNGINDINRELTDSFQHVVKTAEEQLEELEKFHEEARRNFRETLADQTQDLVDEHDKRLQNLRDHHNEARRIFDDRMDAELRKLDERHMRELAQYDDRIAAILREQRLDDRQAQVSDRQRQIDEQKQRISRAVRRGYFDDEERERKALADLLERFRKEDRDSSRQTEIDKIREQRDAHAERLQAERDQAEERLNAQKEALEKKLKTEEEALQESLDKEKEAFLEKAELQEKHLEETLRREEESFEDRLQAQEQFQKDSLESSKQYLEDLEDLEEGSEIIKELRDDARAGARQATTTTTVPTTTLTSAMTSQPEGRPSILNEFNIESMVVRDDQDIELVAEKLYHFQEQRNLGVR